MKNFASPKKVLYSHDLSPSVLGVRKRGSESSSGLYEPSIKKLKNDLKKKESIIKELHTHVDDLFQLKEKNLTQNKQIRNLQKQVETKDLELTRASSKIMEYEKFGEQWEDKLNKTMEEKEESLLKITNLNKQLEVLLDSSNISEMTNRKLTEKAKSLQSQIDNASLIQKNTEMEHMKQTTKLRDDILKLQELSEKRVNESLQFQDQFKKIEGELIEKIDMVNKLLNEKETYEMEKRKQNMFIEKLQNNIADVKDKMDILNVEAKKVPLLEKELENAELAKAELLTNRVELNKMQTKLIDTKAANNDLLKTNHELSLVKDDLEKSLEKVNLQIEEYQESAKKFSDLYENEKKKFTKVNNILNEVNERNELLKEDAKVIDERYARDLNIILSNVQKMRDVMGAFLSKGTFPSFTNTEKDDKNIIPLESLQVQKGHPTYTLNEEILPLMKKQIVALLKGLKTSLKDIDDLQDESIAQQKFKEEANQQMGDLVKKLEEGSNLMEEQRNYLKKVEEKCEKNEQKMKVMKNAKAQLLKEHDITKQMILPLVKEISGNSELEPSNLKWSDVRDRFIHDVKEMVNRQKEMESKLGEWKKKIDEDGVKISQFPEKLETLKGEYEDVLTEVEKEKNDEITKCQERIKDLHEQVKSKDETLRNINTLKRDLEESQNALKAEKEKTFNLQRDMSTFSTKFNDLQMQKEKALDSCKEAKRDVEKFQKIMVMKNKENTSLSNTLKEREDELNEVKRSKERYKFMVEELNNKYIMSPTSKYQSPLMQSRVVNMKKKNAEKMRKKNVPMSSMMFNNGNEASPINKNRNNQPERFGRSYLTRKEWKPSYNSHSDIDGVLKELSPVVTLGRIKNESDENKSPQIKIDEVVENVAYNNNEPKDEDNDNDEYEHEHEHDDFEIITEVDVPDKMEVELETNQKGNDIEMDLESEISESEKMFHERERELKDIQNKIKKEMRKMPSSIKKKMYMSPMNSPSRTARDLLNAYPRNYSKSRIIDQPPYDNYDDNDDDNDDDDEDEKEVKDQLNTSLIPLLNDLESSRELVEQLSEVNNKGMKGLKMLDMELEHARNSMKSFSEQVKRSSPKKKRYFGEYN